MSFPRLQTSQSRLNIQWDRAPDGDTYGVETLADALEHMARRSEGKPLLVNRMSDARDPKVQKLYTAALKSERFSLASQWFHCVKVGDEVLHESHPLHELFAGKRPAALVLVSSDGKDRVAFLSTTRDKVKWAPIAKVLKAAYRKNPTTAVKELEKLLCEFDMLDGKENELKAQMARAQKKNAKRKVATIEKKMAELAKEKEVAFAEELKLRDLVLRKTGDE